MRKSRGSWWWAQIMRFMVYVALGFVSFGLAVWIASRYPLPIRIGIVIVSWILGMLIIDIRIKSEPVLKEEKTCEG